MVQGPLKIIIYLLAAVLIFFGFIFVIASNSLGIGVFFEGLIFLVVAGLLLFVSRGKRTMEIKQTLTMTGPIKAVEVRCPNCGAEVDPTKAVVIEGKPYVTCSHCGNKFELTEEPTW
jgi:DNA-directed RNA polymerase subunit RPC12/RpoP